jgi:hypothetical protein
MVAREIESFYFSRWGFERRPPSRTFVFFIP